MKRTHNEIIYRYSSCLYCIEMLYKGKRKLITPIPKAGVEKNK